MSIFIFDFETIQTSEVGLVKFVFSELFRDFQSFPLVKMGGFEALNFYFTHDLQFDNFTFCDKNDKKKRQQIIEFSFSFKNVKKKDACF